MKWIPKIIRMRINNKETQAVMFTSMICQQETGLVTDRDDIVTGKPKRRFP